MQASTVRRARGSRRRPGSSPFPARASALVSLALVLMLAGCGTVMQTSVDFVRTAVAGKDDLSEAATKVAALPYASLLMDDGQYRAVMVLGNDDEGRLSWHSRQAVVFLCEGGVLCGTHGLRAGLDEARIESDNPFTDLRTVGEAGITVSRRYDWRSGYRYGVPVTGQLRRVGQETVADPLGRSRTLARYEERLEGPGVEGTNTYWVDPATGVLWKSRQLAAPDVYLEISLIKPYRRRSQ